MKKKWIVLSLILVVFLAAAIWGVYVGKHAYHLYQVRQEIKGMLQGGLDSVSPAYAFDLIHGVDQDLNVLEKNLKFFYPGLDLFGGTFAQVQPAIAYLDTLVNYALLMETKVSPIFSSGVNNQVEILQILNSIFEDREFVHEVYAYSIVIPEKRNALDVSSLPLRFQDDFLLIDKFLPLIKLSGEVLPYLPELIGLDSPSQYLLLALNHDELRGGGGFITAMGTLSIRNLANIDFVLHDSYQFDDLTKEYPLPPQPMQDYLLAGVWLSRDGNWSPDFPTSAQKVQELFKITNDIDFKGVIAFDQEAVRQVVAAIEPVLVDPGENIWVDQANVIQFMRESWGSNAEQTDWWSNRKDFMSILGRAILETIIQNRDMKKVVELTKITQSLVKSGHVLIYFNNTTMQSILLQQEMAGNITTPSGDSLYWVDSNIGFNKVDSVVQRNMRYEVDLRDPVHPKAHLIMKFVHPVQSAVECQHIATYGEDIAYANMLERCYWDYWRLYIPPGSKITSVKLTTVPAEWLLSGQEWQGPLEMESDLPGFKMAAGLMVLPTFSTQEIELNYDLPAQVVEFIDGQMHYNLTIFKQFGLNNLPLDLKIQLTEGSKLVDGPVQLIWTDFSLEGSFDFFESKNLIDVIFMP